MGANSQVWLLLLNVVDQRNDLGVGMRLAQFEQAVLRDALGELLSITSDSATHTKVFAGKNLY
jgi:hypothetical protein